MAAYTELHLHTCYSFLEGASRIEELLERAAGLGYDALAVTDHDGLYGAMAFAQLCKQAGIRPITGVELTLTHGMVDAGLGPVHLTLLAETSAGYANLCRLVTEAHRSSDRDEVALGPGFLERRTDGLIVLTGCRSGELAQLVDAGRFRDAEQVVRRLVEWFGPDDVFVELQQNLVQGDTQRITHLVTLAERLGLPVVATGNVHYHERARHRLQDALVALKHHRTLENSHRERRPNSEFFLRSHQEMARLFAAYPQAIANTEVISERCRAFDLSDRTALGYEFPDFARRPEEQDVSADEALTRYCWGRFENRYPPEATPEPTLTKARNQLAEELGLVAKHKLAGFFLIYRDLQELATEVAADVRGKGTARGGSGLPPGRGRGSAVSSIICYLVGLSHVDPVRNNLFLHRFLNEDLQTVPDIDLDFARDIREQLILRVLERYGHDYAALVCTYATYHLRSAVRDLGKVLGLPEAAIDKLAKLSEGGGANTVRAELERLPELQGQAGGPLWGHLVELAEQVDGMPRHVGQHVGGMIISSRPLIELVPVQPAAMDGRFICQWDKDSCDDARFIKIDFLALGMLSLVEDCLELIWQNRGEQMDLSRIPYDDKAVYDAICHGDTVGLFQIESRAQIQMLPRTQPRDLNDLAVQVAIVRPGPIVGGAVNPYVRRREIMRRRVDYVPPADHPLLEPILHDTLGIVLYQDQVLEVAMALGGFTPGQADKFRRAMSRRRSHEDMEQFREAFIDGAMQRNCSRELAESIFEKLLAFSDFGFPKSHAYAFAVLAYQSAWLRMHYPAEYYAALFNSQPMGFYAPHVLVGDAKRHGVPVLRTAINRSGVKCTVADGQVLLGFTAVRGLNEETAQALVAERDARGPYRSLGDVLRRTGLPYHLSANLITMGAFSEFGLARRELLWQLGLLLPQGSPTAAAMPRLSKARPQRPRQLALQLPTDQDMVQLADLNQWERMLADFKVLNLSTSMHPMAILRSQLPASVKTSEALHRVREGSTAQLAGMVVCRQRPGTAKGFVFLLVEDETGLTNVVITPDLYDAERGAVRGAPYLVVEGTVENRTGSLNLIATRVAPLEVAIVEQSPQPPLRNGVPGNPHDPRERPRELATVTPVSRDFH